ncbi:MAG: hypothetical protein HYX78_14300 [Armatimonadetes bacterium]|nr:hypothetical protein [Armatimonadota bacterium]
MNELITQEQVDRVLQILGVAAPLAGIAIGAIIGRLRGRGVAGMAFGLVFGLLGTGVFGLWRLYHIIGARLGYTSTANLAVQLAVFAGLGLVAGVVSQKLTHPPTVQENTTIRAEREASPTEENRRNS